MRVSVVASSAVHIKDTRVKGLLVVEGKGQCIQTTSPILPTWFLEEKVIFKWINKCTDLNNNGLEMTLVIGHFRLTAIV